MTSRRRVCVRRAYDERQRGDGVRVLVDRLWPRGLSRERAGLDEFRRRCRVERREAAGAAALDHLHALARRRNLTLLTATRAAEISEAPVRQELLDGR